MNDKAFIALISILVIMIGILSFYFSTPKCVEATTLDQFENNKTLVCERTK